MSYKGDIARVNPFHEYLSNVCDPSWKCFPSLVGYSLNLILLYHSSVWGCKWPGPGVRRDWTVISVLPLTMRVWSRLGAILRVQDLDRRQGKYMAADVVREAKLRALQPGPRLLSLWAPGRENKFRARWPTNETATFEYKVRHYKTSEILYNPIKIDKNLLEAICSRIWEGVLKQSREVKYYLDL